VKTGQRGGAGKDGKFSASEVHPFILARQLTTW
jgi:hypothetical protein